MVRTIALLGVIFGLLVRLIRLAYPLGIWLSALRTPTDWQIRQCPKGCIELDDTAKAKNFGATGVGISTEELPVAIVIMRYIKDGTATFKHVFTAENGSIVRLLEGPPTVKSVIVRAHDV